MGYTDTASHLECSSRLVIGSNHKRLDTYLLFVVECVADFTKLVVREQDGSRVDCRTGWSSKSRNDIVILDIFKLGSLDHAERSGAKLYG